MCRKNGHWDVQRLNGTKTNLALPWCLRQSWKGWSTTYLSTLSFVIIPGMFRRNLTKIGQIYLPYKFFQRGCNPSKIKCEILANRGSQTIRVTPGASLNRKPVGQRDLLASMTIDQDFPGKVTHCRHVFFLNSLSGALRRTTQKWAKLPKAKENRGKNGKTGKCAEEQDSELTDSFQNYDSRQLLMFLYQGQYLHKEKETSFLTLCNMAKTGLTATSLFEIWTSTWSYVSTNRYHNAISFLDRMVLFLSSLGLFFFSFSFTKDFWFFHEQRFFLENRASTCEFCKVRDVNKIWK